MIGTSADALPGTNDRDTSATPATLVDRAATGAALLVAVLFGLRAVSDPDVFWHIAAGREILETRHIPRMDRWSLLSLGRPWLDVHWLAQVPMAVLERVGGFVALQLATALGILIAAWMAVRTAGGPRERRVAAALLLLALLASWQRILPRPDLVSLVFPVIFLRGVDRLVSAATPRAARLALAGLTAAQVLWSNLHGSFVLGPVMIGLELLAVLGRGLRSSPARRVSLALALVGVATLVNPRGPRLWSLFGPYLHAIAARFSGHSRPDNGIAEWIPPLAPDAAPYVRTELVPYLILLALCVLGLVAPASSRPGRSAVLVAFAVLSLTAIRNIAPFAFVAVSVLPAPLCAALARASRNRAVVGRAWSSATAALAAFLAWAVATNRYFVCFLLPAEIEPGIQRFAFPAGAVGWIDAAGLTTPVFHNYASGGYMLWRMDRRFRTLLDGRLDLLAPDQLTRYRAALGDPRLFAALAKQVGITHVLLAPREADSPILLAWLDRSPAWRRAYADPDGIVWARFDQPVPHVEPKPLDDHPLDAWARRRFAPLHALQRRLPLEALNRAVFHAFSGDLRATAAAYEDALRHDPGQARWRARLIALYEQMGDLAAAERHRRRDQPRASETRVPVSRQGG